MDGVSDGLIILIQLLFFEFINPSCKLPKRRKLSGKILSEFSDQVVKNIKELAQKDSNGVTLTMDGWTNVVNQNIMGSILITSSGEVLVWQAMRYGALQNSRINS